VDGRPVVRLRNGLSLGARGVQPGLLGDLNLTQRLLSGRSKRLEVGDVGDVASVLLAVEDVDVVVLNSCNSSLEF